MNLIIKLGAAWIGLLLLVPSLVFAGVPVFPGAEGYGTQTPAGRGGAIFRVTRTTDSSPAQAGELRWAVEAQGPRVVVFETSGTITLTRELVVRNPFITVAGQSAPSPGVMVKGRRLRVATHDVLIQHLRLRPGDQGTGDRDYNDRDGITISDPGAEEIYNVVIDHCSLSWSPDEIVGIRRAGTGAVHDITVSNSILAESLIAGTGDSYGVTYGEGATNIAFLGNFLSCNKDRNPLFRGGASGVFLNNLVYNGGAPHTSRVTFDDPSGAGPVRAAVVGNVFREGPSGGGLTSLASFSASVREGSQFYAADNALYGMGGENLQIPVADFGNLSFDPLAALSPLPLEGMTIRNPEVAESRALLAGARPDDRDAVDLRLLKNYRSRTGAILHSQTEVGGWPALAINSRPFTAPPVPEGDDDGDGYTNLEEVLHALAEGVETEKPLPSCSDGTLNGSETGLDCGGSCAPCSPRGITDPAVGFRRLAADEFRHYPKIVHIQGGTKASPVVLDQSYTEYVLDGNLSAPGTALVLKASNVTVNLNGFAVTYHTSGQGQEFGIRADAALKNVQIVNGTIRQSSNVSKTDPSLKGSSAIGSVQAENGVQYNSLSDSLFAGLNVYYRSASTCGISMMWSSGNEVKFCTFTDQGDSLLKPGTTTSYWDRSGNFAAVRFPRYGASIHHNRIINARQCGLTVGNGSRVFQNDIRLLSRHTNSAGVTGFGVRDVAVFNNRITGTGAHLFGVQFGADSSEVRIYGNYINLKNSTTMTNMWEPAYLGANGFRTTWGLSNSSIHDNTMVIGAYDVPANPGQTEAQGLSIGLDSTDVNVSIYNNDIEVKSLDGIPRATAVAIHAQEGGALDIRDNYLKSNHSLVAVSTDYGTCKGYPLVRDNRFGRLGSSAAFRTIVMDEWGNTSWQRTARFISNIFGPGTSFTSVKYPTLYKGYLNDISQEHYLDLQVRDAAGSAAPGRIVLIRDNTGTVVFSGMTDAEGKVRAALPELWLTSRGSSGPAMYFTPGYVGTLNRIETNPYTVTVEGVTKGATLFRDEVMTIHLP